MSGWESASHRTASASVAGATSADWPLSTVAENACRTCHRPHTAGGHERLLIHENEEDNCLNCHTGQVARTNIRAEIDKLSAHDPRRYLNVHDPAEGAFGQRDHVECSDCHNSHAASAPAATSGGTGWGVYTPIGATLAKVPGVTLGGGAIQEAQNEYEVCLRCHGDAAVELRRTIVRQSHTTNLRLKFSPSNPSYHPISVSIPNRETVSLVPGLSLGSLIRCTDCHNSDTGPRAGGGGPDGPHGSAFEFLLERNYTVRDDNVESAFEYAMCYKCHLRTSILADQSFPFHRVHIVEGRSPCSACHDPHGVSLTQGFGSEHTHLINFDTTIVRPDTQTRRMEFRDQGRYAGSCTLVCHGVEHVDLTYGQTVTPAQPEPAPKARMPRLRRR